MKLVFYLCILSVVGLSLAGTKKYSRGCVYIEGRCFRECEEGTHGYSSGCGQRTREPTCEVPHPEPEGGALCDYSACYCDSPTVRDTKTNTCVPLDKC